MAPSSHALVRLEAMSADATASGMLGNPSKRPHAEPEEEGCLEVASDWSGEVADGIQVLREGLDGGVPGEAPAVPARAGPRLNCQTWEIGSEPMAAC